MCCTVRLELCCQSRCLKFGIGISTDVPTTKKYVREVKALKLEEALVIEQNGISDHNASCCPAIKSRSAGISGFSFLKNMWRDSSLQTQQSGVIFLVETVVCQVCLLGWTQSNIWPEKMVLLPLLVLLIILNVLRLV